MTPRPWTAARSNIGCSEPSPRYGVAVTASATRGLRGSSHVEAYAFMVLPISDRNVDGGQVEHRLQRTESEIRRGGHRVGDQGAPGIEPRRGVRLHGAAYIPPLA